MAQRLNLSGVIFHWLNTRQGRIFSPLSHEGREGLSFLTGVLRLASARGTARLAECGGCLLRFA